MANRFTDTEKWKDEWFLSLEPTMKILWLYICDSCDFAGVWKVNFTLASFSVGTILDKQSALNALGDRVKVINDNKWHIPKFIYFQQKGFLSPTNNAHKGILRLLDFHGIETSPYLAPSEPHGSDSIDSLGPKVKVKVKVKVDSSSNSSSLNPNTELVNINPPGFDPRKFLDASKIVHDDTLKPDQLIQLFNDSLPGKGRISHCHGLSSKDLGELLTTRGFEKFNSLETWQELFSRIESSDFLLGNKGSFVATLNWLVVHDNALKVLNGQYNGAELPSNRANKLKTRGTPDNPTGNPYLEELRQMGESI
jgi:hypothetical protein